LTNGQYITDVPGHLRDLEWNFFDEIHRIHVHGTYDDFFKVFAGKTFSVNTVRLGRLPILVQVANAKIADGLFYQAMTILGILYVHQIVTMTELAGGKVRLDRRWLTASHWLFRPLHAVFNRMLMRLQAKQDGEDNMLVRARRLRLREAGFRFASDEADFINSNQLDDHVMFPEGERESRLDFSSVVAEVGAEARVTIGHLELLVRRETQGLRVWPGICPHEGAALSAEHRSDDTLQCPWHGRRFRGSELRFDSSNTWRFRNFVLSIQGCDLVVRKEV